MKLTGCVAGRVFLAALFASRKAAVVVTASSGRDWGARSLTLVVVRTTSEPPALAVDLSWSDSEEGAGPLLVAFKLREGVAR